LAESVTSELILFVLFPLFIGFNSRLHFPLNMIAQPILNRPLCLLLSHSFTDKFIPISHHPIPHHVLKYLLDGDLTVSDQGISPGALDREVFQMGLLLIGVPFVHK
jgi:hypothetical protein